MITQPTTTSDPLGTAPRRGKTEGLVEAVFTALKGGFVVEYFCIKC